MEQELNWITLVDEEGHEHRFNLINVLELDGMKYAIMVPELHEDDEEAEEEEAVIFRIETDDEGEEVLVDIEDDDEFNKVCEALEELAEEEEEEDEKE